VFVDHVFFKSKEKQLSQEHHYPFGIDETLQNILDLNLTRFQRHCPLCDIEIFNDAAMIHHVFHQCIRWHWFCASCDRQFAVGTYMSMTTNHTQEVEQHLQEHRQRKLDDIHNRFQNVAAQLPSTVTKLSKEQFDHLSDTLSHLNILLPVTEDVDSDSVCSIQPFSLSPPSITVAVVPVERVPMTPPQSIVLATSSPSSSSSSSSSSSRIEESSVKSIKTNTDPNFNVVIKDNDDISCDLTPTTPNNPNPNNPNIITTKRTRPTSPTILMICDLFDQIQEVRANSAQIQLRMQSPVPKPAPMFVPVESGSICAPTMTMTPYFKQNLPSSIATYYSPSLNHNQHSQQLWVSSSRSALGSFSAPLSSSSGIASDIASSSSSEMTMCQNVDQMTTVAAAKALLNISNQNQREKDNIPKRQRIITINDDDYVSCWGNLRLAQTELLRREINSHLFYSNDPRSNNKTITVAWYYFYLCQVPLTLDIFKLTRWHLVVKRVAQQLPGYNNRNVKLNNIFFGHDPSFNNENNENITHKSPINKLTLNFEPTHYFIFPLEQSTGTIPLGSASIHQWGQAMNLDILPRTFLFCVITAHRLITTT
jgi:hypothetical protein